VTRERAKPLRSHCPVNYALEAIGDRWALLILRDIVFRGLRSYGDFVKAREGWATNMLASRLEQLTEAGILRRDGADDDGRKARYSLTEKGLDLIPVVFEMVLWSAKHDPLSEAARIPGLVARIEKNNRAVSRKTRTQVERGEVILGGYLAHPGGKKDTGV
jgi:DNA-binding HxlR family transcriptional regulator